MTVKDNAVIVLVVGCMLIWFLPNNPDIPVVGRLYGVLAIAAVHAAYIGLSATERSVVQAARDYRKLVARKFDGSARRGPGRPRIKREVEQLIIRMASESRDWGYDRIAGALANLGHEISDQTVGNVVR